MSTEERTNDCASVSSGIKPLKSSKFGQIGPLPTELGALGRLKQLAYTYNGKWCLQANSFTFDGSSSNLLVTRKGLKSFEFRPDRINYVGLARP